MATGNEVRLTQEQQLELSSIAQSRSLPAGYVFRATRRLSPRSGVRGPKSEVRGLTSDPTAQSPTTTG
jgi:hypothetical protein